MGTDILPGHTYTDGEFVNGPSLTDHVGEATIKPSFYSARTAKDPAVLTDEILVRDTVADAYRKVTLSTLVKLIVQSGSVINFAYGEYTANSNLTATIPQDDTVPQNTEGTEIVTATITPTFSTSVIMVHFQGVGSVSNLNSVNAALFRDAAADALASAFQFNSGNGVYQGIQIICLDSPSTTSAITYRVRVGPGIAGTLRMNGTNTQRYLGGTMRTTLTLQEIK